MSRIRRLRGTIGFGDLLEMALYEIIFIMVASVEMSGCVKFLSQEIFLFSLWICKKCTIVGEGLIRSVFCVYLFIFPFSIFLRTSCVFHFAVSNVSSL